MAALGLIGLLLGAAMFANPNTPTDSVMAVVFMAAGIAGLYFGSVRARG
jgi:hypothetical protein